MPVLPGSVMFRPAATATAASAQFPPLRRISRPHWVASGCVLETMPLVLWTTERREGKAAKRVGWSRGLREEVVRGMTEVVVKECGRQCEICRNLLNRAVEVCFLSKFVIFGSKGM